MQPLPKVDVLPSVKSHQSDQKHKTSWTWENAVRLPSASSSVLAPAGHRSSGHNGCVSAPDTRDAGSKPPALDNSTYPSLINSLIYSDLMYTRHKTPWQQAHTMQKKKLKVMIVKSWGRHSNTHKRVYRRSSDWGNEPCQGVSALNGSPEEAEAMTASFCVASAAAADKSGVSWEEGQRSGVARRGSQGQSHTVNKTEVAVYEPSESVSVLVCVWRPVLLVMGLNTEIAAVGRYSLFPEQWNYGITARHFRKAVLLLKPSSAWLAWTCFRHTHTSFCCRSSASCM